MPPDTPATHLGHSRQSKTTLRERADEWFGANNLSRMEAVRVGRGTIVFVAKTRLWIYDEDVYSRPSGLALNLTDKHRDAIIDALEGFHA